jgi:hypothetical protein
MALPGAHAIFPSIPGRRQVEAREQQDREHKGNVFMRMRDALGPIYSNPLFACLFSHPGPPAEAPAQLALVLVMP